MMVDYRDCSMRHIWDRLEEILMSASAIYKDYVIRSATHTTSATIKSNSKADLDHSASAVLALPNIATKCPGKNPSSCPYAPMEVGNSSS
jgi:hypothetical protein